MHPLPASGFIGWRKHHRVSFGTQCLNTAIYMQHIGALEFHPYTGFYF
ncbi:MAG: hypothetical protein JNL57_02715 [Bacteroidetes bacterium]|nr:hypothetical protein [Bacteroidota bacterium]